MILPNMNTLRRPSMNTGRKGLASSSILVMNCERLVREDTNQGGEESELVLMDGLSVGGDILVHSGTYPDASRINYCVDVEEFSIRLRVSK